MLDLEQTQKKIVASVKPTTRSETIHLDKSLGRILAKDIISNIPVPPVDNSAMDGYALHTQALSSSEENTSDISQRIAAGTDPSPLKPGTAARIFTGSVIPPGANAVVMQENCREKDGQVIVCGEVKPGQNIRKIGQDIAAGDRIAKRGEKVTPQLVGLIASIGEQKVSVYKKIRVAIICTGDELVEPGTPLNKGKIYNSNLYMLRALISLVGCEVQTHILVKDNFIDTCNALETSAESSDIIISTGGVSVGEEDHVKTAVAELGHLDLWKVRIKPGKPLAFGKVRGIPFLGLPGNPVSAFVTFVLFAIPLFKKCQGQDSRPPFSFFIPAAFERKYKQSRPDFIRVKIEERQAYAFANQSSGVLTSVCWADALARIPEEKTIALGDLVEVFPLELLMN